MLSLTDYRSVVAIAEQRHFRRAAASLGVSQPALTARLRRIETHLGARLFERGRAGVEPTPAGLAFLEGASSVLDTAQATEHAVRSARDGLGQTLRIGMTQIAAYQIVGESLSQFRGVHPLVRVKLFEGTTAGMEAMLEQRRIDVAFLHPPLHSSELSDELLCAVPMQRACLQGSADRAMVRYPRAEAPVLMQALTREESVSANDGEPGAEADTVLGAALLSQAGYGPFAAPADFDLLPAMRTRHITSKPTRQQFETSIAWRNLDRRPVIRAIAEAAQTAAGKRSSIHPPSG